MLLQEKKKKKTHMLVGEIITYAVEKIIIKEYHILVGKHNHITATD